MCGRQGKHDERFNYFTSSSSIHIVLLFRLCISVHFPAMEDDSPKPTKRVRKSCERCRTRKQRCAGFPVCTNCLSAKEECKQPPSAIEEYRRYICSDAKNLHLMFLCSGPNQALLERISYLESQLASYTNVPPPAWTQDWCRDSSQERPITPATSHDGGRKGSIADIVGFLSLGGERAYVGASSGFAMASSLGQVCQICPYDIASSDVKT